MKRSFAPALLLLTALSCRERGVAPPAPSSSSAAGAPATSNGALERIARAEVQRDASAFDAELLASRDVNVRRAAARALSRIADDKAVELLQRSLSDADPEVIAWSAYGLGYACRGREQPLVRQLVARAATLAADPPSGIARLFSAEGAIADALGRCGGKEAESSLRAWLDGPTERGEAAALALGRIAGASGQLDDASVVRLLDAAARPERSLEYALYPFTRVPSLSASAGARLLDQARRALERDTPASELAVRALARVSDGGGDALREVITRASLSVGTRASAARELGKLGAPSQHLLARALGELVSAPPSDTSLLEPSYNIVAAVLGALSGPLLEPSNAVNQLASLPVSGSETPAVLRRKLHLRCQAAALLAGHSSADARLLACDPRKSGREGALALLRVLDRAPLNGARSSTYLALAASDDALVREAALALIPAHPELSDTHRLLASALGSGAPGVVASAARTLAAYPNRAAARASERADDKAAPHPDASVLAALSAAFQRHAGGPNVELENLLIDAAGAVELLGLKEPIVAACQSDNPSLREHAQKALRLLGDGARKCAAAAAHPAASAPPSAASARYQVKLATDVGELTFELDGARAPLAVARVAELVRAGFYDGLSFHRVVPGFVAQFGDPGGDGYGGADRPPLRCETAPLAFERGSVGVALAGRDTGNSQLFVTLGRHPYLDGDYTLVGKAGPGWERVAEGDIIEHATLVAAPL